MSYALCLNIPFVPYLGTLHAHMPHFVVPDSVVGNVKNLAGKVMGDKELEAKGELGQLSNLAIFPQMLCQGKAC